MYRLSDGEKRKSLLIAWVKDSNIFYEFEKIAHTPPTKGKIVTFSYHLQKMSTVFIRMERVLSRISVTWQNRNRKKQKKIKK